MAPYRTARSLHNGWAYIITPICLSVKEVAVGAGHEVLLEVDVNSAPIVCDPQEIFEQ